MVDQTTTKKVIFARHLVGALVVVIIAQVLILPLGWFTVHSTNGTVGGVGDLASGGFVVNELLGCFLGTYFMFNFVHFGFRHNTSRYYYFVMGLLLLIALPFGHLLYLPIMYAIMGGVLGWLIAKVRS